MSRRSTIMPPSTVNSGIGGRIASSAVAERARVERQRFQRAAVERRALRLLLVIGMQRIGAEFDVGLAPRASRPPRAPNRGTPRATRAARNCRRRRRENSRPSRGLSLGLTARACSEPGKPGRAGRERARAADIFRALDEQHGLAGDGAEQSRGEAAGAGADDDEIELAVVGQLLRPRRSLRAPPRAHPRTAGSRASSPASASYMSAPDAGNAAARARRSDQRRDRGRSDDAADIGRGREFRGLERQRIAGLHAGRRGVADEVEAGGIGRAGIDARRAQRVQPSDQRIAPLRVLVVRWRVR